MRPMVRDFFTGVTALIGVGGLIVMLMMFGELTEVGQRHYTLVVHVDNASGLAATSPVTLNGVRIGQVQSAAVRPAPDAGAELVVRVKEAIKVPRSVRVSVDRSLVGDASLEFSMPPGTPAAAMNDLLVDGDVIEAPGATTLFARLEAMVAGPLERFSTTADSIDALARTYTGVGERLNDLLAPRTLAEVEAGAAPNVRTAVARADAALAGVSSLIGDGAVVADTKAVIARAGKVLGDASALAAAWSATASRVDEQVDRAGGTLDAVSAQALATLRRTEDAASGLALTLETARTGPGTVGQLMQNPDLYNSLRDAAQRLDRALTEFQLLVETYKTEGIPLKL